MSTHRHISPVLREDENVYRDTHCGAWTAEVLDPEEGWKLLGRYGTYRAAVDACIRSRPRERRELRGW